MSDGTNVRLRINTDPTKSLAQLHELIERGSVLRAVIIAEFSDTQVQVLGQKANPTEMAQLMVLAAKALAQVAPKPSTAQAANADPMPPASEGTIAEGWESLSEAIFDKDTGPLQRSEMRRAFYAGGMHLIRLMMSRFDDCPEDTPADLAKMEAWYQELQAFGDALEAGRL